MTGEISVLHTYATILANMEDGDSFTNIQRKTNFAYTTIYKSVLELEKKGIIRTEERITKYGKAKKCFLVKPQLKELSDSLINVTNFYRDYLNGKKI